MHDHPLMSACNDAFDCYITQLTGLLVKPVQLFYEAALLLDRMIECDEPSAALADRLWTDLVAKVRATFPNNEKPNDWNTLVSGVFYTVAVALSLHPDSLYRVDLRLLLLQTIRKKIPRGDLYEEERVVYALSEQAHELKKWIIEYISEDNGEWLSDVVERVANGGPYMQTMEVVIKPQAVRKPTDPDTIEDSFTYCAKGISDKAARLQLFFTSLKGRYIDKDTDEQQFIDMFMGKTTSYKVTWIGDIKELKYLFLQLFDKKKLVRHKHSKWISIRARFQFYAQVKSDDMDVTNDKLQLQIVKLTQGNFNTSAPKKHESLDRIIKILDPKTKPQQALDDFLNFWTEETREDEKKDDDFALANGLNISDRPY